MLFSRSQWMPTCIPALSPSYRAGQYQGQKCQFLYSLLLSLCRFHARHGDRWGACIGFNPRCEGKTRHFVVVGNEDADGLMGA